MNSYSISSKAGADYGVWHGDTAEAAFEAMVNDGGSRVGDESVGTIDDWIVVQAGTGGGLVIGAGTDLGALTERMGGEATEADAEAFLDLLREKFSGWTTDCVPEESWLELMTAAVDGRAVAAEDAGWWVGRRVEAGTGDDHDTGVVIEALPSAAVMVAWDSGVRTPANVSALREL